MSLLATCYLIIGIVEICSLIVLEDERKRLLHNSDVYDVPLSSLCIQADAMILDVSGFQIIGNQMKKTLV